MAKDSSFVIIMSTCDFVNEVSVCSDRRLIKETFDELTGGYYILPL